VAINKYKFAVTIIVILAIAALSIFGYEHFYGQDSSGVSVTADGSPSGSGGASCTQKNVAQDVSNIINTSTQSLLASWQQTSTDASTNLPKQIGGIINSDDPVSILKNNVHIYVDTATGQVKMDDPTNVLNAYLKSKSDLIYYAVKPYDLQYRSATQQFLDNIKYGVGNLTYYKKDFGGYGSALDLGNKQQAVFAVDSSAFINSDIGKKLWLNSGVMISFTSTYKYSLVGQQASLSARLNLCYSPNQNSFYTSGSLQPAMYDSVSFKVDSGTLTPVLLAYFKKQANISDTDYQKITQLSSLVNQLLSIAQRGIYKTYSTNNVDAALYFNKSELNVSASFHTVF
jgi:hypothetical protein